MTANAGEHQNKANTDENAGGNAKGSPRFLGSLRDALRAAGMSDDANRAAESKAIADQIDRRAAVPAEIVPPANIVADAARPIEIPPPRVVPADEPQMAPDSAPRRPAASEPTPYARPVTERRPVSPEARTQLVRGRLAVPRTEFHQDPVVGWLVVVGGQGLGAFRPIFEGNNTIGRARTQRVAIDFGDEAISNEEQAYIRYDSADRSFLFVPNLSKTNVVSVNNKKPTAAVPLEPMDVITMGRTQLAFIPFCGNDFDWSELAERKK